MSKLKEFMPAQVRAALGNKPTWHSNCIAATARKKSKEPDDDSLVVSVGGIARPGKTARDRARRGNRG